MADLQRDLQRLSGTKLDAQGAANVWAGTTGLDLLGALNAKAGTARLDLCGVLSVLAGRPVDANSGLAGVSSVADTAFGLWRASSAPATWTASAGVPNEGTGGAGYNMVAASQAATLAAISPTATPASGNRVTPTWSAGGFDIGLGLGTTADVGSDYGFFVDAAFDLSGSFTWVFDFAPKTLGATFWYLALQGGAFGYDGFYVQDATDSGGFLSYVGDAAGFTFTPPFSVTGAGVNLETMALARQQYTFVVDRATNTYRCYRNGVALAVDVPDISTMGDATSALPLVIGPNLVFYGAGFWKRALTAAEVRVAGNHLRGGV